MNFNFPEYFNLEAIAEHNDRVLKKQKDDEARTVKARIEAICQMVKKQMDNGKDIGHLEYTFPECDSSNIVYDTFAVIEKQLGGAAKLSRGDWDDVDKIIINM